MKAGAGAVVVGVIAAAVAACGAGVEQAGPITLFTHCGVDTARYEGETYYATAIYDGTRDISGTEGFSFGGGPSPWVGHTDDGTPEGAIMGDLNHTYGDIRVAGDGTAIVTVRGGRYSIHFSDNPDAARWAVEGCY